MHTDIYMKSSYSPLPLSSLYFALVYPFLQKNKNETIWSFISHLFHSKAEGFGLLFLLLPTA